MTMISDTAVAGNRAESERLQRQRDLALACAILAVAMTAAMLWSNFGVEPTELRQAQEAVRVHQRLLIEHQELGQTVHAAMIATRHELERIYRDREKR